MPARRSRSNKVTARHNASAGIYGFGQRDQESVNLIANDGSSPPLAAAKQSQGNLEAAFLEDQFKPLSWLTLTAGVRLTHFARRDIGERRQPARWAERCAFPI